MDHLRARAYWLVVACMVLATSGLLAARWGGPIRTTVECPSGKVVTLHGSGTVQC